MNLASLFFMRRTPPRSWAEQAERDRVGACRCAAIGDGDPCDRCYFGSAAWGPCPDLHDPFPLLGELPRRGRTKTLIGMPRPR